MSDNTRMGHPLFPPSSVFWRVNRELASGLAGPRAVLMQIAHPLVAAGVADHSRFRKQRFARLYRTSMAAAAITFGSRELALRVIRSINRKHEKVHGTLRTQSGIFPPGTPYDANDPELKLWVLSTITDSTLLTYESFVGPLTDRDREEYYRDSLLARRAAIPPPTLPKLPALEKAGGSDPHNGGNNHVTNGHTLWEKSRKFPNGYIDPDKRY